MPICTACAESDNGSAGWRVFPPNSLYRFENGHRLAVVALRRFSCGARRAADGTGNDVELFSTCSVSNIVFL